MKPTYSRMDDKMITVYPPAARRAASVAYSRIDEHLMIVYPPAAKRAGHQHQYKKNLKKVEGNNA
jgi:hypothetical protein